ncbi:MAG TPA: hypothetical protein VMP03_03950 [Methylomirabilota bacterium]|nr:hypothetical protein [Methylomirabilota bacterium]
MPSSTPFPPTATATLPAPDGTFFGAQLLTDDFVPAVLDRLEGAGASYARLQVQWRYIEPFDTGTPNFNWVSDGPIDEVVDAGLAPIINVFGHPPWAATRACGPIDLAPMSRWEAFVQALVERYDGDGVGDAPGSPRIEYWEIGNEQDFNPDQAGGEGDYGSCFGGAGRADYGDYLRAAYRAAKAADPTSRIVFGGVAYDRFYNKSDYDPGHSGPFDYRFVRNVLLHLHTAYGHEPEWPFFDVMSVHVYNDFRSNWDGVQPYNQELVGKVKAFRTDELVRAGVYDLNGMPLAITEASLRSFPSDEWTIRSEAYQASYPGRIAARALSAGVELSVWFSAEDHVIGTCGAPTTWQGHGLLRGLDIYEAMQACPTSPVPEYHVDVDHEPKPALGAVETASRLLSNASFDRQLTSGETGSSKTEAYRFVESGGGDLVVAFTDTGERIGARSKPPITRQMIFNSSILRGWTGAVEVTDHLGGTTTYFGSEIVLTIGQAPIFVRPD